MQPQDLNEPGLACNPGPHVTDLGIADGTTGEVFESSIME